MRVRRKLDGRIEGKVPEIEAKDVPDDEDDTDTDEEGEEEAA